ncbi:MAG: hypothetical protein JOZ99_01580 [Actinobacteria bacterium]|nr:hypothetical protein [Actinomycetota bacterium]
MIANADGDAPVTSATSYRRQAVMALMDGDGRVPSGRVDAGLLQPDPAAAFGVRLDERAVVEAFDLVWRPRSVVLVEGSDLVRHDVSRMVLSRQRREALQHGAMDRTDRLVGVLMARVDATRDVVMVVGPAASSARAGLTVAALRAPGVGAGLLRSGTTRRTRFVQLVDVAPTILDQLGIERPEVMEGRRFEAVRSHASLRSRAASLAGADHAAAFRDRQTTLAATVYTWAAGALVLAAVAVLTLGRHRRRSRGLAAAALGLVVFLPLTYLAGLVPFDDLGSGPYWLFLGAGSIAGGMVLSSWRRHALTPLIAALGIVFALLTVDIVTGGRLQLNTVFGYSPIVAGRFQGMGNLAYSMYTVSAIVLAGLLAHRVRPPWGTPLALGVVAAALLVDGLPFFGSDVGGVLSLVPAAGVFTMVLLGRRVRARVLLAWMATAAGALAGVGLLDLSRPPHHRTHLGRLFEKVGAGDLDGIVTVIQRKLHANLSVLTSVWIVSVLVSLAFVAWLAFAAPRRMAAVRSTVPELHAALSALPVLLVLGFALNDSGIAVPGMMFGVIDSVLVYLAVWVHPGPGVGPGSDADRAHGTGVSP